MARNTSATRPPVGLRNRDLQATLRAIVRDQALTLAGGDARRLVEIERGFLVVNHPR